MEFFSILLSGLLVFLSPAGLVIDKVVEGAVRSRFDKIEQLQVRVDNTPNYQALQGKVDGVRIAGRGLWLTPDFRIGLLELETDPINLDLPRLRQSSQSSPRSYLRQPLQAGVHLEITESDINQALLSPAVQAKLQELGRRLLSGSDRSYQFNNLQVEFLENNRLRFQAQLREGNAQPLVIMVESGVGVASGHSLEFTRPVVSVDGKPAPDQLVQGLAQGVSNRLDIRTLEKLGITARLLQLDINTDRLQVAAFVRVEPSN